MLEPTPPAADGDSREYVHLQSWRRVRNARQRQQRGARRACSVACGVLAAGALRECSARPGEEIEEQRVRHARTLLVQLRARIIAPTLAPLRLRAFVAQSTAAQLRRRARRGRRVRRAIASLPHERVDTAWDVAGRSRRRVLHRAATDGRRVRSAPGVRPEPCGCRVCAAPAAGKCVRSATTARDRAASTRREPILGARRGTVHRRGVGPGHVICRPALRRAVPPPFPHAPPARARDTGGEARALTGALILGGRT